MLSAEPGRRPYELAELIECYQYLEDWIGWEDAGRMLAAFGAEVGVLREVAQRARELAGEERGCGNLGEAVRLDESADALEVWADRIEREAASQGS